MRDFRSLVVWQKAHALTLAIYKLSNSFSPDERFGLTSQIRRASMSIPTNIAEGCGRATDADFARFLHISFASASEVEYLLLLAHDLGHIKSEIYQPLEADVQEVKKCFLPLSNASPKKAKS